MAAAVLRVVALSSDAYTRLDWSAGLLTDEGFYLHNARNVAIFGEARTDEFNNMLLSPVLHAVQVAVFSVAGVGIVQARAISVVSSLLSLLVLWAALRRCADGRVALTATLFLALDHTSLLYHRLALMDTPACLPAVGAFYAFVRGCERTEENCPSAFRDPRFRWLLLCGLLLGLTVTNRMLAAYLLPVPFVALWRSSWARDGVYPVLAGLLVVLLAYAAFWYMPHRVELTAMNTYYRTNQVQPRSLFRLYENVRHAFLGDFRGISPYLFRHTPVVYGLALGWIWACLIGVGKSRRRPANNAAHAAGPGLDSRSTGLTYLTAWFVLGWGMLASISYSPSRYYITLYPAMASLAAVALWKLVDTVARADAASTWARIAAAVLGGFAVFHAMLAGIHYGGLVSPAITNGLLIAASVGFGFATLAWWEVWTSWLKARRARIVPALLLVWALADAYWLTDWARRIDYTQVSLSRYLAEALPEGSVLIGDLAPAVTIENRFKAIHVQPGLVNWWYPVERFEGPPRYIVILDGRWKERYWTRYYEELVAPDHRIWLGRVLRWDVGIYSVDRQ